MQILNELMPSDTSYNDILSFDMDNCIDEAGRRVALTAPLHMLTATRTSSIQMNQTTPDGHILRVAKPVSYLRLISAHITGWIHPVYGNELITPEHSLYARQANKITAGGANKPIVALANNQFEFYSIVDGYKETDTANITYFPDYKITDWETESLGQPYPSELIEPVVWQTASLLFNIMEEHDNAALAQNRCNELLTIAL